MSKNERMEAKEGMESLCGNESVPTLDVEARFLPLFEIERPCVGSESARADGHGEESFVSLLISGFKGGGKGKGSQYRRSRMKNLKSKVSEEVDNSDDADNVPNLSSPSPQPEAKKSGPKPKSKVGWKKGTPRGKKSIQSQNESDAVEERHIDDPVDESSFLASQEEVEPTRKRRYDFNLEDSIEEANSSILPDQNEVSEPVQKLPRSEEVIALDASVHENPAETLIVNATENANRLTELVNIDFLLGEHNLGRKNRDLPTYVYDYVKLDDQIMRETMDPRQLIDAAVVQVQLLQIFKSFLDSHPRASVSLMSPLFFHDDVQANLANEYFLTNYAFSNIVLIPVWYGFHYTLAIQQVVESDNGRIVHCSFYDSFMNDPPGFAVVRIKGDWFMFVNYWFVNKGFNLL